MRHPFNGDNLHPAMTAADYTIAAIGRENAELFVLALTAGWLTPDEAQRLRPIAAGVAYLAELDVTTLKHRGKEAEDGNRDA